MKTNYLSAPVTALNPSPVTIAAWASRSPAISQKETKRTKVRGVGFAFLLAAFLGSCVMTELRAQVIVVPNSLATNDGETFSTTPTGPAQVRNMKIYDASQFGALSGPSLLTRFAWRPDSIPNASGPRTVTLRIYASTTSRSVAGLSMTFADNVGTNNTLVFNGTLIWTTQNLPGPGNTRQFDILFPLTTPFLYDPADGNLLLDFQQYGEGSAITYDRTSDTSLTRQVVNSTSSNAPTAQFDPGSEVVTQFTFQPQFLIITDAVVAEGDSGPTNAVFTVQLTNPFADVVTVDYATTNGSAVAGVDYVAASGTLTFQPGETNQTISVTIPGNTLDQSNRTFFVHLTNLSTMPLFRSQALGTILDDDPQPSIAINDISVREGDAGLADATFTLSLSAASALPASVRLITANGTATLRLDYVPTNIVLTFPPGTTNLSTTIKLISDTLIESNETFVVNFSSPTNATIADSQGRCTILDDDLRVASVEILVADVRLRFTTQTNQTYRVERTDSLAAPMVWEVVSGATNVPGTGAPVELIDAAAAGQAQRFYRVRLN